MIDNLKQFTIKLSSSPIFISNDTGHPFKEKIKIKVTEVFDDNLHYQFPKYLITIIVS